MNSKINLFSKKETFHKEVRKVIIISIGLFSVVFLITLGVVLTNLFRNIEYNNLQVREDEIRGKINQLSKKRDNILKLHDRLAAIENFFKTRKLVDARFISLTDIVPDSITFSEVTITGENISLHMKAENLADYNTILDLLYKLDEDKELKKRLAEVKKIQIASFVVSTLAQTYELEMNFDYGKGT